MPTRITELWEQLQPLVVKAARKITAEINAGGGGLVAHGLSSALHTGTLADSQAPQFLLTSGARPLAGNLAVGSGVTIDGVDLSEFRLSYDLHVANPHAHHAAFVGISASDTTPAVPDGTYRIYLGRGDGTNTTAAGSTVLVNLTLASPSGLAIDGAKNLAVADTLAGAGLAIAGKVLSVGQGDGLSVTADAVALATPGSLSVASANAAAGNHTHAVTSSSNPGAAASLLATSAAGLLALRDLTLTNSQRWGAVGCEDAWLQRPQASVLRLTADAAAAAGASLAIGGRLSVGDPATLPTGTSPGLDVRDTVEPLRLRFDAAATARFLMDAGGALEIRPTGEQILNPRGRTVRPLTSYETNLGTPQRKWLSLHVAELWADALVAQETIATIGGRVLVAPTTVLEADLAPADTAILVKHNMISANDVLYLERDFRVEFMRVTGVSQNYVRDASFEDAWITTTPPRWQTDGTVTLSQQATAPNDIHGKRFLRVVATSGTLRGIRQDVAGLTSGASYRLSVYVRAAAGTTVTLRAYDGGGRATP